MHRQLSIVAAIFVVSWSANACACDCKAPPEPKEALKQAAAVFTGKVTSIARGNSHWRSITFEVDEAWKRLEGKSVHVVTALSGTRCGFHFEDGKTYLVYAHLVGATAWMPRASSPVFARAPPW